MPFPWARCQFRQCCDAGSCIASQDPALHGLARQVAWTDDAPGLVAPVHWFPSRDTRQTINDTTAGRKRLKMMNSVSNETLAEAPSSAESIILARGVSKNYAAGKLKVYALREVSLN